MPGLDDGASDVKESLAMAQSAISDGITHVVATPHSSTEYRFDYRRVRELHGQLQRLLGDRLVLATGCDFHLNLENIQDALANPPKYAINYHCYLLVEFSDLLIPRTTQEIFDRLQGAGLTPIVTHPERNALLHTRLDQLQSWVENGALVQVTAGSLLGGFGRAAKSVAIGLMNRNLVHFIASDAHDARHRTPVLRDAYEYVEKTWNSGLAKLLFTTAPQAVIAGEEIALLDPTPTPRKRKWYRLGF